MAQNFSLVREVLAKTAQRKEADSQDFQEFLQAYIEAAEWAPGPEELEKWEGDEWGPASKQEMVADAQKFFSENRELIGDNVGQAGHDFWLTRNGHGVGFWDRDGLYTGDPDEKELTEAAEAFGSKDLYVGDDNKMYVM